MQRNFGPEWFARHQRPLRLALNTPGLGRELRRVLGVQLEGSIVAVYPHASIVQHGPQRLAEFHARPVLARRLHANFLPLWTLFHWFDLRVANPLAPAFNLGFDTLTKYPDPNPETNTFDGYVMRFGVDETWATIRAGAGTDVGDSDTSIYCYTRASTTTDQFDQLRRLFTLFDTSALGAGATITEATWSVWGIEKANALGSPDLTVVSCTTVSDTAANTGDYSTTDSTSFGSIAYSAFDATDAAYSTITLDSNGRAAISKTGITRLAARLNWDQTGTFGGTWASAAASYFRIKTAENVGGQANTPKLVVTYTPGVVTLPIRCNVSILRL